MRRRESALFTSARELFSSPCFMAAATSARAAPARRMFPGIVGLGKAAELAKAGFENGSVATLAELRDQIESTVLDSIEATGVNGDGAPRVPNTTNIYFDYIEGEALVIALDLKGLAVSTGAACSSGAIEPSHVLTAMGLRPDRARASLRFSLGKQNTPEDVDFALSLIPATVRRLRELSPVYNRSAVEFVGA